LSDKPSPPTTPEGRRQLIFQSCRFFTSRYGNLGQHQSLGHERVAALALTLEVRPVTGRADFRAPFLHFKLGKLTLQLFNARVQAVDVRPLIAR
jgi:hypothetical protein